MRRHAPILYLVTAVLLAVAAFGLAACEKEEIGSGIQQAGAATTEAGTAFGMPQVALLGAMLSGIGSIVAGKKAGTAQTYAHTPFTMEEAEEMAQQMSRLGYQLVKAPKV